MWPDILIVLAAYLWGSIPTGYIVVHFHRGVDIRKQGSGNVGATNVIEQSGKVRGLLVGAFDCLGKGAVPVAIAALSGQSLWLQASIGLAAVLGHNWSVFMRFTGGRGVATGMGVVLAFLLWYEAAIIGVMLALIGRMLFKEMGFWTFVALLLLPVLTVLFGRPVEVTGAAIGVGLLLLSKRVTANWEPPVSGYPLRNVLINRLLLDRDVPRKADWVNRRPAA
jgi:glycerol-3-phosphate acyltransferase PlsY